MGKSTGQVSVMRHSTIGLRVWFGRAHGMPKAHTHHDLEFNYVQRGSLSYLIGGQLLTLPPGTLTAIWGSMPHQSILRDPQMQMAWATAPMNHSLLSHLAEPFIEKLLREGLVMDPCPRTEDWSLFERWERDLKRPTLARRDLVLREIELRLLRLSLDVAEAVPRKSKTPAVSPALHAPVAGEGFEMVQRMAAYIADHYTQDIHIDDMTSQVELHPNYAMTLFRRHMHMTLNTYLTRQRVAHAQRLLATTHDAILAIGLDSGFGSSSRFFEAFKQHAGLSPRAYRQKLTGR